MKKDDIFDKISPDEALEILRQITKTDKKLGARVRSYHLGIAMNAMEAAAEKIKKYLEDLAKESSE